MPSLVPRSLLVPGTLIAQAILVLVATGRERLPAMPDLDAFPSKTANWTKISDVPIAPDVRAQLGADRFLERLYIGAQTNSTADILVAWFQSQRGGKTQPHSPAVCLPGSGFTPVETGIIQIPTDAGTIPVNRYVVASSGGQKAVVLYWYQTPRRILAGEWESKFWLIPDAIRDHRTDIALVRVVVWATSIDVPQATNIATAFTKETYPTLRRLLPR